EPWSAIPSRVARPRDAGSGAFSAVSALQIGAARPEAAGLLDPTCRQARRSGARFDQQRPAWPRLEPGSSQPDRGRCGGRCGPVVLGEEEWQGVLEAFAAAS